MSSPELTSTKSLVTPLTAIDLALAVLIVCELALPLKAHYIPGATSAKRTRGNFASILCNAQGIVRGKVALIEFPDQEFTLDFFPAEG
ncbi:hypothetical protein CRG98_001077 [Punica granatum]|uniref:Uncharacterized protein n=1 Tax=Punica granatum TaxID=22663 RepID=A0A2I0LCV6_PUNGR|nr:hypothetical protein CRG98_001077 [Punica granatum]